MGNPINLLEGIGTGVKELIFDPFYDLLRGKGAVQFGKKFY